MADASGKSSVRFDATSKRSGKDVERDATGVDARLLPSSADGGGPSSDLMAMAMYVPAPRRVSDVWPPLPGHRGPRPPADAHLAPPEP